MLHCNVLSKFLYLRMSSNLNFSDWRLFYRSSRGENSYLIPLGGSDHVGLFGYINVVDELQKQACIYS